MASPTEATAASAGGNRWRELAPLDAEATRRARVTVLLDGDRAEGADPAVTRRALAAQEHPAELIEILSPAEASSATGEVVIVIAAGSAPVPGLVTEHLRRQLAALDVVGFGPAPDPGSEDPLAEPLGIACDMTRDLMEPAGGVHLLGALGNVSLRREKLEAIGGLGEGRIELAARLESHGSLFVPIPAAESPAEGGLRDSALATAVARAAASARTTIEAEWPHLAATVALEPFRRAGSPRRHELAAAVVNVVLGEASDEEAAETIAALLASETADVELRVQAGGAAPGPLVEAAVAADPRASLAPSSLDAFCASPIQIVVPGVALPDRRTLGDLIRLLVEGETGALHVTVPGAPPQDTLIEVFRSGALGRARRVAADRGAEPAVVLGRMFGERWVSGVEVSVRRHGVDEPQVTEHGPLAAATDRDHERIQHLRFRDRALELESRTDRLAERSATERLEARELRARAEGLEARLAESGDPPRGWRLRPVRTAASRVRQRLGSD